MINAALTLFSSYLSLSLYVLWQEETLTSRKRCGGIYSATTVTGVT